MKILVLTWEFPPRIVGGIARHVAELYPELVKLGHEVHLITVEFGSAPLYEVVEGVQVHRVSVAASNDFFHWVVNLNESIGSHGAKLMLEEGSFDVIHAHDWLVGDAAIALKHNFKVPLIATIHATEHGRHNGIRTDTQLYLGAKKSFWLQVLGDYCLHRLYRREVEWVLESPWTKLT
jgi:glycosyltransferase involved in cell wall biosynthesis